MKKIILPFLIAALLPGFARSATYTYNIYLSTAITNPATFSNQFLGSTTSQYTATVSSSPWFANTFDITILGNNPKWNPAPPPPPPPPPPVTAVSFDTTTFQTDLQAMIGSSSMTYLGGWRDGESAERIQDINTLSSYQFNCSSVTYFAHTEGSSTTWDLGTCEDAIADPTNDIYTQSFSTPTIVPGF